MSTTVTMSPAVYDKAVRLAKRQNLSVDDYISQIVELEVYVPKTEKKPSLEDRCQSRIKSLRRLRGILKDSDKTWEELRDDYIKEKYGV